KSGNSTSNLLKTAQQCDADRGIVVPSSTKAVLPYSLDAHRAILAMRTATSNRLFLFNNVTDKYYRTRRAAASLRQL
ncbi:hypothetical protein B0H14DRAFT_2338522, partial [Mycena olivaceomarginata]